jgi:hypothetical protein
MRAAILLLLPLMPTTYAAEVSRYLPSIWMRFTMRKCLIWTLAVLATMLVVVFGVAIFSRPPHVFIDCNGRAPISSLTTGQVVFTGKILTTFGPCVVSKDRPSFTGAVAVVRVDSIAA